MNHLHSKPITECQVCGNKNLESIFFLGFLPLAGSMQKIGSGFTQTISYPLELQRCPQCSVGLLGIEIDKEVMYPPEYSFLSSSTRTLRDNFVVLCDRVSEIIPLQNSELVVDVGSNDGNLLTNFLSKGHRVLGVEPTSLADIANANGVQTICSFFDESVVNKILNTEGKAKVVTATNVLAHMENIHEAMKNIAALLDNGGVFAAEVHYLSSMIKTLQYDTIYHAHLRFFTVTSLMHLLEQHGLEIFNVEEIGTHGGSIRIYAAHQGERTPQPSVAAMCAQEQQDGIVDGSIFKQFRDDITASKIDLMRLLGDLKRQGKRVCAIGAPPRGCSLACYMGFDEGLIESAMEISSSPKIGKYMPGTKIPILDEKALYETQPEYALLLSWHVAPELMKNLSKRGYKGDFIIPLPSPKVVSNSQVIDAGVVQ